MNMVKLTGPGLAAAASGQLGNELIFSSWKGKAYLKKYAKPKQPKTRPQIALRAAMQFLSQNWGDLTPAELATWSALAARTNISPFNAYQSHNLTRARNNQRPTTVYPGFDAGLVCASNLWTATGGTRQITIAVNVTILRDTWGFTFSWVSANLVLPTWEDHIHHLHIPAPGLYQWKWSPVPAGTYWIAFSQFTRPGKSIPPPPWRMATVTD